ncbi:TIGR04222 domain-containing membrane protein [Yinghuangia soli]|uniref:TIGR04222 domain-containing membrane protein n=1 Tax=Yinghuangia soli TaxID=2908204 RepID=A0AA41PX65_9ACTN|nr:TIGR04222 domain-containing membrane protein [Yinghuangia soli]MCF2527388.1 TIGR04222 domain-containing membrane protein [Yinghuangia soli]
MVWLILSLVLFVAAAAVTAPALKAARSARAASPAPDALDLYQLAFLAGGPGRTADIALLAAAGRGAVSVAENGRLVLRPQGPPTDPFAAAVDAAAQAAGDSATVAGSRLAVAANPAVTAVRDRVFAAGLLNPSARNSKLRPVRVTLSVIPLVVIAGLFAEPLAGSPSEDTGLWVANLVVAIFGTLLCLALHYFLFTSYDKLRAPLNDMALFHLWNLVRDPAVVQRLGDAVPGGKGLGEVALYGLTRIHDPLLREVFLQAARVTAGRVVSDGWTEEQWKDAVESKGRLGGTTYADAYRAANEPAAPGAAPGAGAIPGQGPTGPGMYGGGAGAPQAEQRPPWENHPHA